MGMQDIKTDIQFGACVSELKENISLSKGDLLEWEETRIAQEMGVRICEEKGWHHHDQGNLVLSDIRLYVFTPTELHLYMDAKFKARLREMAANERYLTDREREVLMIQSERF